MYVVDLHILQTFPLVNLNRGEDGAPKSLPFGGVVRGSVSSQCQKRATRIDAKTRCADFGGVRTKGLVLRLTDALKAKSVEASRAEKLAYSVGDSIGMDKDGVRTSTIMFLSPQEIDAIATEICSVKPADFEKLFKEVPVDAKKPNGDKKLKFCSTLSAIIKKYPVMDKCDIAAFGRMVANDHDLAYDGAVAMGFPFTIHKVRPVIDFFSAVDEDIDNGSGHIDEALYNSGTYYRDIEINLGLYASNLPELNKNQLRTKIDHIVRAAIRAVPSGKHNATLGNTFPGRVLGIVKDNAPSISLADAFERPVTDTPYMESGWDRMTAHWNNLKSRVGSELGTILCEPKFSTDPSVPGTVGIDDFCKEILANVWKE